MGKLWHVRKFIYKKDNPENILQLRDIVFGKEEADKLNILYWDWEFKNNYAGKSQIYLAAIDDNKEIPFVGHYAVSPAEYLISGKNVMGSIVVDVMTHDDYRFQGMFSSLGKFALADVGESGIAFSIGFPVRDEVMPGHLKVGWKYLFDIPILVKPMNFKNLFKHFFKINFISSVMGKVASFIYSRIYSKPKHVDNTIVVSEITHFDKTFDNLQSRISTLFDVMQKRSSVFLNWRFVENPYREYKKYIATRNNQNMGYIVARKEMILGLQTLIICDIIADSFDKNIIEALLGKVYQLAENLQVDLIGIMINKDNPVMGILYKNGFIKSGKQFKFIVRVNNREVTFDDFAKDKRFLYTWADSDTM